jgi:hypothetical protein
LEVGSFSVATLPLDVDDPCCRLLPLGDGPIQNIPAVLASALCYRDDSSAIAYEPDKMENQELKDQQPNAPKPSAVCAKRQNAKY